MSEITVASTTDTQEAIDQAAGTEPETRADQAPGDAESQPGSAPAEQETEERKSGTQKRIDTLTRRLYEQQEELDALKRARTGQPTEQDWKPTPVAGLRPKPGPDDKKADGNPKYAKYEEFVEDLADWKAEQNLHLNRQAELNQAEQERTREVFNNYNQAATAARVKYGDFEEVVGRKDVQIPQAAQIAIIEAGDAGPDIAYYLGKHPEVCAELVEMSPMRAVARIGQIEAQLQVAPSQAGERGGQNGRTGENHVAQPPGSPTRASRGGVEAPSAVTGPKGQGTSSQRKPASSAPAPITPVGGSSSKSAVPLSELPYRDYKRIRDKEERENRYR